MFRVRKPNRATTPRRAVIGGTRAGHRSMPRAGSRWAASRRRDPAAVARDR
jgi:hypothetical protein